MIKINNIYKNFGNIKVLKGVSTTIKKGEKVVIIGASGSGKSTLLRCMNLLEEPTFGEVWLENKLLTPVDPYLHEDIIVSSNTYKKLFACNKQDDTNEEELKKQLIKKIKAEDLLNEKNEGKEYKKLMKKYYKEFHLDTNKARQNMGMCIFFLH